MDRRQSESELHFNYKHICAKMFKLKQNIKTEVVCKHLVSEAIHKQSFPKMFPQFHKDLFQKNLSAPIAPVPLIIFVWTSLSEQPGELIPGGLYLDYARLTLGWPKNPRPFEENGSHGFQDEMDQKKGGGINS